MLLGRASGASLRKITKRPIPLTEAGFTLIELLVAIAIMAIILGVAVLNIPNHDERYWRDNLDQLISNLNMAQEESVMSASPTAVQMDSQGWRFLTITPSGAPAPISSLAPTSSNGLMVDAYRPQAWNKPVEMAPMQLTLGGEEVTQALQIPVKQDARQALILRNRNGRFSWIKVP